MKTLCRCLIEGQKYGRWKPTETSVLRSFTKAWFHCLRTSIPGVLGLTFRAFFLILTRGLEHVVCLGESRLSQVNNSPRANVFPAGVANFGKAMYQSQERPTKDTRDGFFCTVPRPHFLGRALIWPGYFGEHILGLFGLHPSSLSKSAGFVFLSGKASLVSISAAILLLRSSNVYFLLEFEFRGKSCVEWEHGGEDGLSCLLPCML